MAIQCITYGWPSRLPIWHTRSLQGTVSGWALQQQQQRVALKTPKIYVISRWKSSAFLSYICTPREELSLVPRPHPLTRRTRAGHETKKNCPIFQLHCQLCIRIIHVGIGEKMTVLSRWCLGGEYPLDWWLLLMGPFTSLQKAEGKIVPIENYDTILSRASAHGR